MVEEYRAVGKEIVEVQKVGGLSIVNRHYADAVDDEAAIAIAYALNSVFLAKLGDVKRGKPNDDRTNCRT